MGYRVLLVGSGGREHALAWKIARGGSCERLLVAPGNPGVEGLARRDAKVACAPVRADDTMGLLELAVRERVDLVVCGPEGPLAAGLGDAFAARGVRFFGPTAAAAEIEGSKAFAKAVMAKAGVPTAAFGTFEDVAAAEAFIERQPGDVVVKADGLCAGKGVVVASSRDEARAAVRAMLSDRAFGAAGARVVIEERLRGREVSVMGLCDGERFVLLASAEDHKQVHDGDRGPNTGGMGAYSPSPLYDDAAAQRVAREIFAPTVRALAAAGRPFRGVMYAGLMLTPDRGPMVIEWNCRFGDPETQPLMMRWQDDVLPWLAGAAEGRLPAGEPAWRPGVAVCVVLAAHGYPGAARTGDAIAGLSDDGQLGGDAGDEELAIFHAGTRRDGGRLLTAGGRVLGVTAAGNNLGAARERAYAACERIRFDGMHFRRDIGARPT